MAPDPLHDVLFVCTANQGRSPLAMAFCRQHLDRRGVTHVTTRSAGRLEGDVPISREVVAAAAPLGADLADHRSTQLRPDVVAPADLVLVMAAEHLGDVARHADGAPPPTHLLRPFVAAARQSGPRGEQEPFAAYVHRVGEVSRAPGNGMAPADEVEDPYGHPIAFLHRTAQVLHRLTGELVDHLWPRP